MRLIPLLLAFPATLLSQLPEELFKQQKYNEAKVAFEARLAKNKNDANALFYMGRIAEETGKTGDAVDWYEKALKLNDTSATYHFWLGSALGDEAQKANKFRQPFLARRVKSEFERAVQLDPKMIEPRRGLVDFYSMAPGVMGGSMEKARAQAEELNKLHPFQGHFAMARVAQREKDVAAEGKAFEAAYAAGKDSATTYYSLAAYYRRQNRFDDAFAIYDSLMKRYPDEIYVHANYGGVAALSGKNMERGERELKQFLTDPPKDVTPQSLSIVRHRLGMIYEKTGRKELARAEYTEAVKQNPQNKDAKKSLDALGK